METTQTAMESSQNWPSYPGQLDMYSRQQSGYGHPMIAGMQHKADIHQLQSPPHCPQTYPTPGMFNGSMADMLNGINLHSPIPDMQMESNATMLQTMQMTSNLPPDVLSNSSLTDVSTKKKGKKNKLKAVNADCEGDDLEKTESPPKRKRRRIAAPKLNGMTEEEVLQRVLPDHLCPNLDIVIIGINPGLASACVGHHYAGPANHFWKCMYLSGLIPEPFTAYDDHKLLNYGIGFTNIVARTTRSSADLTRKEIKAGGVILKEKIEAYKPKIAVFNGIGIYELFLGRKDFHVGKQPYGFPGAEETAVFVMPSSSARFTQLPRAVDKLPFYLALKKLRDFLCGRIPAPPESEVSFPEANFRIIPKAQRPGYEGDGNEGKKDKGADPSKTTSARKSKSDEETLTEDSIDDSGIAASLTPEDQELIDDITPIVTAITEQNAVVASNPTSHFTAPVTPHSQDLGISLGQETPTSDSLLDQSGEQLLVSQNVLPPHSISSGLNFSPGSDLNFSPLSNSTAQEPVVDGKRNESDNSGVAQPQVQTHSANQMSQMQTHNNTQGLWSGDFSIANQQGPNNPQSNMDTGFSNDESHTKALPSIRAAFSPGASNNSPRPASNHSNMAVAFPPVSTSNTQFPASSHHANMVMSYPHSNQQGLHGNQPSATYPPRTDVLQQGLQPVNMHYHQSAAPQMFHQQMAYPQGPSQQHQVMSPYFGSTNISNPPTHQNTQFNPMQSSGYFPQGHQVHANTSTPNLGAGHVTAVSHTPSFPSQWQGQTGPHHFNFVPENSQAGLIDNTHQHPQRHPYWNSF